MNREEIIQEIITLLRQHGDGLRGSIHQEPYKGDFFRLFAAAFNAGLLRSPSQSDYLSADALTDLLHAREPELALGPTWENLRTFWQEWTYAWRRASEMDN